MRTLPSDQKGRLALDLLREQHSQGRAQTTKTLHKARAA